MCTNLTITGSTPPPGGIPTIISKDFATEDLANCTTYECIIGKIISSCTKNVGDLGNGRVAIVVVYQVNDSLGHRLVFSFKIDGVLKSYDTVFTASPGQVAGWVIVPDLYYKNASKLENLTASFTS